jgi:hypothetical protein
LRQRRAAEEQQKQQERLLQRSAAQDDDDAPGEFKLMPSKALEMPVGHNVWKTRADNVLKALRRVLAMRMEQLEVARRALASSQGNLSLDERHLPFKYQKTVARHEPCG